MALPQKAQAQLDAAETLLQQMNAEPAPAAPPEAAAPAEPQPTPQEAAPPAPAPSPDLSAEQTFEQRYRSLQGVHRSMEQKVRDALAQNAQLQAELEKARRAPEPKQEVAVDPRDADVFGSDLVDMVKRVSETVLGHTLQKLDARLSGIERQMQGTAQTVSNTAEDVFLTRLREQVPDYATVNSDPAFLQWLGEEDPVYGVPRQEALTAAANALDYNRVAKVFLAFKKSVEPAARAPAAGPPSKLERQIAPSSVSAPTPQAQEPQYMTVAQVQAFYEDVRAGKYRGRDAEYAQREAFINNALANGRILERAPRRAAA